MPPRGGATAGPPPRGRSGRSAVPTPPPLRSSDLSIPSRVLYDLWGRSARSDGSAERRHRRVTLTDDHSAAAAPAGAPRHPLPTHPHPSPHAPSPSVPAQHRNFIKRCSQTARRHVWPHMAAVCKAKLIWAAASSGPIMGFLFHRVTKQLLLFLSTGGGGDENRAYVFAVSGNGDISERLDSPAAENHEKIREASTVSFKVLFL